MDYNKRSTYWSAWRHKENVKFFFWFTIALIGITVPWILLAWRSDECMKKKCEVGEPRMVAGAGCVCVMVPR